MRTCFTCGGEARPYGQRDVFVRQVAEFVPCPAMDHYLGVSFPNQHVVDDPWAVPSNYPGHPAYDPFKEMSVAEFTVRDGVAWLGLTWEQYEAMNAATKGRHGGPQVEALMAVRTQEQRAATTPEQVLARCGIDPADPVTAARNFDSNRAAFDAGDE